MKNTLLPVLLLCLLTSTSFGQDTTAYPLKAEARVMNDDGYYPFPGRKPYSYWDFRWGVLYGKLSNVELKITNISDKTVYFRTMSCSWEENLILSNTFVESIRWGCDKNVDLFVSLEPGESSLFETTISILPDYSYTYLRIAEREKLSATRLGFVIIADFFKKDYSFLWPPNDKSIYQLAHDEKTRIAVIWSNPLSFI